jgi:hypothetical protein
MMIGSFGEDCVRTSEQTMWCIEAPSGRSVTCHVARLPSTDYELRIVYAGHLLAYEVYSELRHALERGTAIRARVVEFVIRAAEG